jgi:hypothetical protein
MHGLENSTFAQRVRETRFEASPAILSEITEAFLGNVACAPAGTRLRGPRPSDVCRSHYDAFITAFGGTQFAQKSVGLAILPGA